MEYVNIRVPLEDALEMLTDRLRFWTKDEESIEMYRQMYESYLYAGVFEGAEFDVMGIVDNDWVNWCSFVEEGEEGWDALLECYRESGLGDCSMETNWGSIEAVDNENNPTCFLVRQ